MLVDEAARSSNAPPSPETPLNSISIEFTDISFSVRNRTILSNLSGKFLSGTMTCILGPSGCGKTTLLNCIGGRARPHKSRTSTLSLSLSINGQVISPSAHRSEIGFVHAHESLFTTDTPSEAFSFASTLFWSNRSKEERLNRASVMLTTLGLNACKDTFIGSPSLKGISSGEKKRTAVGIELLADRKLILVDEPTTGLDSFTAFELMSQLRDIVASRSVCVVAVIHQPSAKILNLFHNVMFIARGGRIVYHGLVSEAVDYFASIGYECPSDHVLSDYIMFLLQSLGEGAVTELANAFGPRMNETRTEILSAREIKRATHSPVQSYPLGKHVLAPWYVQLTLLIKREYISTVRDVTVVVLRLVMSLAFAIVTGFLFFQVGDRSVLNPSHIGLVFTLATFALVSAGQSLVIAYAVEWPMVCRETSAGMYHSTLYSISKDVLEYPVVVVCVLMYLTLGYLLGGMIGSFLLLLLAMLLIGLSGAAISFFFASVFESIDAAAIVSAYLVIMEVLFSGFFVVSTQIPEVLRWIEWIDPMKYGLSIMYDAEFRNHPQGAQLFSVDQVFPGLLIPFIFILVGIFFAIRLLGVLALWHRTKKSAI